MAAGAAQVCAAAAAGGEVLPTRVGGGAAELPARGRRDPRLRRDPAQGRQLGGAWLKLQCRMPFVVTLVHWHNLVMVCDEY